MKPVCASTACPEIHPEARAIKIANRAVLERSCAKLMPYQGSEDPGNRILSRVKQHASMHRALFVRDLTTVDVDWSSPKYKRYITSEDLHKYPSLREFVADSDSQYRDPRRAHILWMFIIMEESKAFGPGDIGLFRPHTVMASPYFSAELIHKFRWGGRHKEVSRN